MPAGSRFEAPGVVIRFALRFFGWMLGFMGGFSVLASLLSIATGGESSFAGLIAGAGMLTAGVVLLRISGRISSLLQSLRHALRAIPVPPAVRCRQRQSTTALSQRTGRRCGTPPTWRFTPTAAGKSKANTRTVRKPALLRRKEQVSNASEKPSGYGVEKN